MPNYSYGRDSRFYCAKQSAFATIRNTGGTADLAAADACPHRTFTARSSRQRLDATDKETVAYLGHIDHTRQGRFSGSASVAMPVLSGSGAGVEPDCGCILEAALGKKTIVASTSVTYAADAAATPKKFLSESAPITCELWGFNNLSNRGVVAYGAVPNRLRIVAGQNSAELSADFLAYYALAQERFPNAITLEKGGLTSWPSEPGSQTYTGGEITSFVTKATLDGVDYNPRGWTVNMNFNRGLRNDRCAVDGSEYFAYGYFENMPEFTVDISLWNDDSTALRDLLRKIAARTAFDASMVIGDTAGGIITIPLNNLYRPGDDIDATLADGDDRQSIEITGLRAQATSTSVRDEVSIIYT